MMVNPGIIVTILSLFGNKYFFLGFFYLGILFSVINKFIISKNIHHLILFLVFCRFCYMPDQVVAMHINIIYFFLIVITLGKTVDKLGILKKI